MAIEVLYLLVVGSVLIGDCCGFAEKRIDSFAFELLAVGQ